MSVPGVYPESSAPHISSGDSVAKRFWLKSAALLPVLVVMLGAGGADFLKVLTVSVLGVAGFEWLNAGFFRKKSSLQNGDAVLTGVTLAVLLPSHYPALLVLVAAFVATLMIKECFGGLGGRLFQPAVFARIFLDLIFAGGIKSPELFQSAGEPIFFSAILLSAFLFAIQKRIYFETPLYFFGVTVLGVWVAGGQDILRASGIAVFAGYFLITDTVTLPLTRRGTNWFAILAACLGVSLGMKYPAVTAIGYAVLMMNATVPWIDHWVRPKRCMQSASEALRLFGARPESGNKP
jgi:Na+-translocating ferredoxin:NAD+ oxidoreductase subunit D